MTTTALITVTDLDKICVDTLQMLSIDARGAARRRRSKGRPE
jgi:hypothetical protein